MKASTLQHFTRYFPLPGFLHRKLIERLESSLEYPTTPLIVETSCGKFEITDINEYIQRNIYFLGYHEFRESKLIRHLLRPGDLFIDIGANIGWFTLLAAHLVGPRGRVIAFEPSSRIRNALDRNIQLNDYSCVKIESIAASDTRGCFELKLNPARPMNTSLVRDFNGQGIDVITEKIATVPFDEYRAQHQLTDIRMIKIDVEGAERMVLDGMPDTLADRNLHYLLIEVDNTLLKTTRTSSRDLTNLLRNCGFSLCELSLFGRREISTSEEIHYANIFCHRA